MISDRIRRQLEHGEVVPEQVFGPRDIEIIAARFYQTRHWPKAASLRLWRKMQSEERIVEALKTTHGDVARAARLCGVSASTIYSFLRRLSVPVAAELQGSTALRVTVQPRQ